jgi:hypothetical protein
MPQEIDRRNFLRLATGTAAVAAGLPEPAPDKTPFRYVTVDPDEPVRPNEREAEAVVEAIWPLQDALAALRQKHDRETGDDYECDCHRCVDATWMLRNLELLEMFLTCELVDWPAKMRRHAEEARREGNVEDAADCLRRAEREERRIARKGGRPS